MTRLGALLADLTCHEDARAERAAEALASEGPQALVALCELLHADNPDSRWWALRALAQRADALTILPELVAALADPLADIRQCAALALGRHPDLRAVSALIMALSDPDPLVARLASQALVAIGAEAVPDLLEILQNGTHPARLEAVRALAQIGDRHAIPLLMKVLEEDSTILHYWAENGLNRLGLGMVYVRPD